MLCFENDYSKGAHPLVLSRLIETNLQPMTAYGADACSQSARDHIRRACACPQADVFFLAGGTQTNRTVIDACLANYEGVIAVETGHIHSHEAGAIEATGHKVLTLPGEDGKLSAGRLQSYLQDWNADANHAHTVRPGMVYISHPTEYGTLYTKAELEALYELCRAYDLYLYLDGARLGYGLAAADTDVTLPDLARLCDAFYIGGTKVGALCGEAVVFPDPARTPKHFFTTVKQNGALLAKGRVVGAQFEALFGEDLYFQISENAIRTAERLKEAFCQKGYTFFINSPTNQIFIVLENGEMERLSEQVRFSFWEKLDERHTVVRFATDWATTDADVDALIAVL